MKTTNEKTLLRHTLDHQSPYRWQNFCCGLKLVVCVSAEAEIWKRVLAQWINYKSPFLHNNFSLRAGLGDTSTFILLPKEIASFSHLA